MRLAFVTLSCPEWTLEDAFARFAANGCEGIEIQLIDGQFADARLLAQNRERLRQLSASSGCRLFSIGTLVGLAHQDRADQTKEIAEGRAILEIAGDLGADFIRVFGSWHLKSPPGEWMTDAATDTLSALVDTAAQAKVKMALETHDEFNSSARVAKVINRLDSPWVVALWDLMHPFRVGDTMDLVLANLGDRLGYVHVKDGRRRGDTWETTMPGEGEMPIAAALQALARRGYDGYVAYEWERGKGSDLPTIEAALPAAMAVMRRALAGTA